MITLAQKNEIHRLLSDRAADHLIPMLEQVLHHFEAPISFEVRSLVCGFLDGLFYGGSVDAATDVQIWNLFGEVLDKADSFPSREHTSQ